MEIKYYIGLAVALFCIGIIGVLTRRNAIIIFMCIEVMLNAVNLLLVAFSKMHAAAAIGTSSPSVVSDAQIFVFFIMVVAAAEVAVGLAILILAYNHLKTTDISLFNKLKW